MKVIWPIFITIIISLGLIFIYLLKKRPKDTRFGKSVLIACWLTWERAFQKLFHVRAIDNNNKVLSLRVRKYNGRPIILDDGEALQKGDKIAELHFNNDWLFTTSTKVRTPVQLAVKLIHNVDKGMPIIAYLIQHNPIYKNVKGLYGVSIINRGTKKFGFTVLDLPKGMFFFFSRVYLRLLLYILHPDGKKRLRTKRELLIPKTIAISTKELVKRYGDETYTAEKEETVMIRHMTKVDHSKA